jgi:hypothetical protein
MTIMMERSIRLGTTIMGPQKCPHMNASNEFIGIFKNNKLIELQP